MFKIDIGRLFILLVILEIGLALAYGYHVPYRDARVNRATHEYLVHPTTENKAAMDSESERVTAPGKKRNQIVMSLLIVNSCLTAIAGYNLLRKK
jgi:hypothetical protein